MEDPVHVEGTPSTGAPQTLDARADATKKKPKTTAAEASPMPGTTALPISKVSKIIKSDKEVQMCQKEAVFLISYATVRPKDWDRVQLGRY